MAILLSRRWRSLASPLMKTIGRRHESALVLGEHEAGVLKSGSISAISAAALALGNNLSGLSLLLVGHGSALQAAAEHAASAHPSISEVLVARSPALEHPLAEPVVGLLVQAQEKGKYSHIFAASTSFGKDVLPRAAALLDVSPITDVTRIIDQRTFVRPIYAGNALSTVRYKGSGPCVVSIRPTAFPTSAGLGLGKASIAEMDTSAALSAEVTNRSKWLALSSQLTERPELGAARIVIAGGRGLKSADNFQLLERLADKLGAAVGASRAAVDAGFVPNDMQIGQTGKIVAPDLYIAVGISGAIQHLAGIKDSKVIVAINKDKDAPIFQVADYGLAMDLFEALPQLLSKVPSKKHH